jgi:hypothetical protein
MQKKNCNFCGVELTNLLDIHHGVCRATRCKGEFGQQPAEIARQDRRAARNKIADDVQPDFAAEVFNTRVVVPSNSRPVVPLPDERREKFISHLEQMVELGCQGEPAELDDYVSLEAMDRAVAPAESQVMGACCGLCRGECCSGGLEHAFIDQDTIRHFRQRRPDVEPDEIPAIYCSYLPTESYVGACVFQGEMGCTLPREIRGVTCNRFMCEALVELRVELRSGVNGPTLGIAINDDQEVQRSRILGS